MPVIRQYQQTIRPSGRISVGVNPGALAAGARGAMAIGEAISNIGATVEAVNERKDKSELQAEIAGARESATARLQDAMRTGEINDDDFMERYTEEVASTTGKFSEKKRSQGGRAAAMSHATQLSSEFSIRAREAKAVADGQRAVQNFTDALNVNRNALLNDPMQFGQILQETDTALKDPTGAFSQMGAAKRAEALAMAKTQLALSAVQGSLRVLGPEFTKQELVAGKWDEFLDADAKASLLDQTERQLTKNTEIEEDNLRMEIDRVMKAGGNPLKLIRSGVEKGLFSSESAQSERDKYATWVELQRKITAADAAFRAGTETEFYKVDSTIKSTVAEAWVAEQMAGFDDMQPAERAQVINRVVQKGARMNYLFEGVRGLLTATPHGESFTRAADTYRSLEAFDPYYAAKYVGQDQRMRFDVYTNAVSGGATQETALEMARGVNSEATVRATQFFKTDDGKKIVEDLRDYLVDPPGYGDDIINARSASDAVIERATVMLAANPSADAGQVVESARKNYEADNVLVNKFWVPREFADGIPSNEMEGTMSAMLSELPTVLQDRGLPVGSGAYVLAPDALSDRDKKLQVFDPTGFPVPGLRFNAADMRSAYQARKTQEYEQKRTAAQITWGSKTPGTAVPNWGAK